MTVMSIRQQGLDDEYERSLGRLEIIFSALPNSVTLPISTFRSYIDFLEPSIEKQFNCFMALELYNSPHRLHPPPPDTPLRIRIQGPLETIQKLLPDVSWHPIGPFPQLGGLKLASLTHQKLHGANLKG
jgi:hypothetical protein